MRPRRIFFLIGLLAGLGLLAGGTYGFVSLSEAADECLRTTGVVDRVSRKRVYRYRKIRSEYDVSLRYNTTLYGDVYTSFNFYIPFVLDEGDEVSVLYNPRLPHEIRLPGLEKTLYGVCVGGGALLLAGGMAWARKNSKRRISV